MELQTKLGLAVICLSLTTGAGGAWLVKFAHARPAANERVLTGTVSDILVQPRDFPLTMGWLLAGCGAFGVLLGAGIIFWVDRSPP